MKILRERFDEKWIPVPESGCWLWTAATYAFGYGMFCVTHAKPTTAHRVAWRLYRGEIPDGLFVLHKCDVPACVNPDHLFLGTHQANMDDMLAKGRQSFGRVIGIRNGNAKLTDGDVLAIRAASGSQRSIAAAFGINHSTVSFIKNGKRRPSMV